MFGLTSIAAVLIAAVLVLLCALVVALWVWQRPADGARWLRRWGLPAPTPEQSELAVQYIQRRRILYITMLVLVGPALLTVFGWLGWEGAYTHDGAWSWQLLAIALLALLTAELTLALRPPGGRIRTAEVVRRRRRDLVWPWTSACLYVLFAATVAVSVVAITLRGPMVERATAHPDITDEYREELVNRVDAPFGLGWVIAALLATELISWLAVRRRPLADPEADAVTRIRSARVATGLCFPLVGFAFVAACGEIADARRMFTPAPPAGPIEAQWAWLSPLAEVLPVVRILVGIGTLAAWVWVAQPPWRPERWLDRQLHPGRVPEPVE